jgi:hypothetical protein
MLLPITGAARIKKEWKDNPKAWLNGKNRLGAKGV